MSSEREPPELITFREAAELLERSARGKLTTGGTIRRWGKQGCYPVVYCNGWKVDKSRFIEWATVNYKLRGAAKPTSRKEEIKDAVRGLNRTVSGMLHLKAVSSLKGLLGIQHIE